MKELVLDSNERLDDVVDLEDWVVESVLYRADGIYYTLSERRGHVCDECGNEYNSRHALAGHKNAHD